MRTMMKVAALALTAAFAAPLCAADKVGAIAVYVSGDVQVQRSGAQEYAPLATNEILYAGDSVKTGPSSQASLAMKGGAEVRMNENSTFQLEPPTKARDFIKLSMGQLWTRMLHKRAKISVRTPAAVCAVRGTEADIEQRSMLTVKVYEGHVDVQNSLGMQSLKAGQMSTVNSGAAPAAAREMGAGDKGSWQENISVKDMAKFLDALAKAGPRAKGKFKIEKGGQVKEIEAGLKEKK